MSEKVYNNPANIEVGQGYAGETGETYGEKGRERMFAVFDSPQMGVRALARDLKTKIKRHGGDVQKIITQFAPDFENPTSNYRKHIVNTLGGLDKVESNNPEHLKLMMKGIIEFENKKDSNRTKMYLSPEILDEGIALSNMSFPSSASYEDAKEYIRRKKDLLSRL